MSDYNNNKQTLEVDFYARKPAAQERTPRGIESREATQSSTKIGKTHQTYLSPTSTRRMVFRYIRTAF